MPYYPTIQEQPTTKKTTEFFRGYNHQLKIADGEFYDQLNMTSEFYPLLANRKKRGIIKDLVAPQALIAKEKLAYVDAGTLFYDGEATPVTGLSSGEKQLVSMGAYICVFPDKVYYNTVDTNDYGSMEATYNAVRQVTYNRCTITGDSINVKYITADEPEDAVNGDYWINTSGAVHGLYIYSFGVWESVATVYTKITFINSRGEIPTHFKDMDAVNISGCFYSGENEYVAKQVADLNGSKVLYAVGGDEDNDDYIVVIGLLDEVFQQSQVFKMERKVPDLDFVCEAQNRLWGCRYGIKDGVTYNEIKCCALGDFRNWERYLGLSTDSYTASVGSDGAWTGCINYLGYPTFFKENVIHRVSVSAIGAHMINESSMRGVQAGSHKSLAVVNETLYYLSADGVLGYQGGFPFDLGKFFGDIKYRNGIGCVLGDKYYLSMQKSDEERELFVYDTTQGMWNKEDNLNVKQLARLGNELYCIADDKLYALRGSEGTLERTVPWEATSGIMYYEYPGNKYLSRYNVRLRMEKESYVNVYIEYDSAGDFELVGQMYIAGTNSVTLPIRPRRCDHLRLKLAGEGDVRIFSITRILEVGSDA